MKTRIEKVAPLDRFRSLTEEVRAAFAPDGPLAATLPGFEPRPGQQALALAWAEAIAGGKVLVAEAATGIGKTLAYLVPALLSGRRTVVSTGTKTLQHQLVENDIPLVRKALGIPFSHAVVKGRGNYLCRRRWKRFAMEPLFEFARDARFFERMQAFALTTRTGDISECEGVPDDLRAWSEVNARSEMCDPSLCAEYGGCHLMDARRRAAEADLVVVNHHLLFADLAMRRKAAAEGGRRPWTDILPQPGVLVLDEAHGIEGVASSFFGVAVSFTRVMDICKDVRRAAGTMDGRWAPVVPATEGFLRAAEGFFASLGNAEGARFPLPRTEEAPAFAARAAELSKAAEELAMLLAEGPVSGIPEGEDARREAEGLLRRAVSFVDDFARVLESDPATAVTWGERRGDAVTVSRTPIEVAPLLSGTLWESPPPTLLTSATLSVSGDLSYFRERVGLPELPPADPGDAGSNEVAAGDLIVDNEFDYGTQSLMYVPPDLPDPTEERYPLSAAENAARVLAASGGGALVLCTTYRMLNVLTGILRERLPFTVLAQGESSRTQVLRAFREEEDAVLVGTGTFWEGIDVPGHSLRCVVIDKLPFAPPADPVVAARIRAIRDRGGDPFAEYQIPEAVLALRQGVGRLLRRGDDYGVVALLDRRVMTRGYGAVFRESLPPMRWTRDPGAVEAFFRRHRPGGREG